MSKADHSNAHLGLSVSAAIQKYFANLEGTHPNNIYNLVLAEIEKPMLTTVMQHAGNNQCKAAEWLGISRNTLRKLLDKYNIN
jgi:Fis family transcriptional regulator